MMVFTARYVLPVAGPPIESGAVAVEAGRVVAVGRGHDVLRAAASGATRRDLGDAAIVPGLVNAHTHLELSWCGERPPGGDGFSGWIRSLVAQRSAVPLDSARAAAERQVRSLLARGTVAIGDLANEEWIAPIVEGSTLHGVLFRELLGFRGADAPALLEAAVARLGESSGQRLRRTLTPHAIYSTSPALLAALAQRAAATGAPLSIHVAESEAESELMRSGTGPLAELLRDFGAWDDDWRPPGVSPVQALDRLGVLTPRTLAVHCVRLEPDDPALLAARGVTVVTCPRSNARLGVGTAPIAALLAAGIRVALGTDSLASAPDLDLFAEMAALRAQHPALAPATVLRMATLHGARALGIDDRLGTLEPGKLASLVCVRLDAPTQDPLEAVTCCPRHVAPV